jgi:predicted secreted hydrolase
MKKTGPILTAIAVCLVAGCASREGGTGAAPIGATIERQFEATGLSPERIETWEDGARTTGERGTYEWWYFDFTLEDGATLVVTFLTKSFVSIQDPLTPLATLTFDAPDGTAVSRTVTAPASAYSSARDRCDVRIGACSVTGDLRDYSLHFQDPEVTADVTLHGTVPSWRPGTGYSFFDAGMKRYFAWLPSVPQGRVEGTITIGGRERRVSGIGYHDHNWGNISLLEVIHHWYWGRARIGDYTVIASSITASDRYGGAASPVFMLARDGEILADDASKVRFTAGEAFVDSDTGKPVAGVLTYEYDDGAQRWRITFRRARDLVRVRFLDMARGMQAFIGRLTGFDGAYLRCTGTVTLERFEAGAVAETVAQDAGVWELMYFGHAPTVR